jgi:hypothetical protein
MSKFRNTMPAGELLKPLLCFVVQHLVRAALKDFEAPLGESREHTARGLRLTTVNGITAESCQGACAYSGRDAGDDTDRVCPAAVLRARFRGRWAGDSVSRS